MSFNTIESLRKNLLSLINEHKIVLWGAGPHAKSVYSKLTELGRADAVVGIFDSTRELAVIEFEGIPVLQPEIVKSLSHDSHIVIVCAGLNELYGHIVPQHLFYFRIIHRRALETCLELEGRLDELQDNIDLFTDDTSGSIYQKRIELMLSSVLLLKDSINSTLDNINSIRY